jgi:hypothetical protein
MDLVPRGLYGVRFYDPKVGFFALRFMPRRRV